MYTLRPPGLTDRVHPVQTLLPCSIEHLQSCSDMSGFKGSAMRAEASVRALRGATPNIGGAEVSNYTVIFHLHIYTYIQRRSFDHGKKTGH